MIFELTFAPVQPGPRKITYMIAGNFAVLSTYHCPKNVFFSLVGYVVTQYTYLE